MTKNYYNYKDQPDTMSKYKKTILFEEDEYKIYARQLSLLNIQIEGQQRLKASKVLCIGAGGLGSITLLYLAAAGVGLVGIMDDDTIELSNLQRQIIYNQNDIGKCKALSAKKHLDSLNNKIKTQYYLEKLTFQNAYSIIKLYDIVIDCTDNFEARYILSYTCKELHKIHIYAAISSFIGQASVFNYMGGPHYYEVYTKTPQNQNHSCLTAGVLGVLPGIMGIIQATEAIKIITGIGEILSGYILRYNALEMSFKKIKINNQKWRKRPSLDLRYELKQVNLQIQNVITLRDLKSHLRHDHTNIYLIDLRNNNEYRIEHLKNAVNIPLSIIKNTDTIRMLKLKSIDNYIVIYCYSNIKTQIASTILKDSGVKHWMLTIA